jgi:hypothetical protein
MNGFLNIHVIRVMQLFVLSLTKGNAALLLGIISKLHSTGTDCHKNSCMFALLLISI